MLLTFVVVAWQHLKALCYFVPWKCTGSESLPLPGWIKGDVQALQGPAGPCIRPPLRVSGFRGKLEEPALLKGPRQAFITSGCTLESPGTLKTPTTDPTVGW